MVLGVPLAKFLPELFKAISKPFVNVLKKNVPKSLFWKDKVFIPMAKYYNKQSIKVRLWTQGIHRNKEQIERSSHLSEEAALELGAEIVAHTITFGVGLVAIIMQQSISVAQERKKGKKGEDAMERIENNQLELHRKVLDLGLEVQKYDAKLREFERKLVVMPGYGKISTQFQSSKSGAPSVIEGSKT